MSFYTVIFYLLAIITVIATALAVTRRNAVHAVVYFDHFLLWDSPFCFISSAPPSWLFWR